MDMAPFIASANVPTTRMSAAERLRRLEEAKTFLRQHLAVSPQPARAVLKAAKAAGIATRTLHRAKVALGVQVQRDGWGKRGRWIWLPLTPSTGSQDSLARARTKKALQDDEPRTLLGWTRSATEYAAANCSGEPNLLVIQWRYFAR